MLPTNAAGDQTHPVTGTHLEFIRQSKAITDRLPHQNTTRRAGLADASGEVPS
jgi:hypothetical protein